MRRGVFGLIAFLGLGLWADAAPLFPDVPDTHWARDAVAALSAKGLLEGYPDGTFKGDRTASRWEVAQLVARLLAAESQQHLTFATREDLQQLHQLALELKSELEALGVRVEHLEESVHRLDQRVTELERITFYGDVTTRVVAQSFWSTGSAGQVAILPGNLRLSTANYQSIAGTAAGAGGPLPVGTGTTVAGDVPFIPGVFGVLGVTDWRTGRPLTSGVGLTSRALLGVKARLTDDLDAKIEFAAYTSQGDQVVNAYYGVSAPFLSNPFTAGRGFDNTPFTNLTFDNLQVDHKPTHTRLTLGAIKETRYDSISYFQQYNPNLYGPRNLPGFGIQVRGDTPLGEDLTLQWEALGTRLPDGNRGVPFEFSRLVNPDTVRQSYDTQAEGANVALVFDDQRGTARINFLHAGNQALGGSPLQVGLIQTPNLVLQWVNPNGYYLNQLGRGGNTAGIGSTNDIRPSPGFALPGLRPDGSVASFVGPGLGFPGLPNFGGIGPQDQTTVGLTFNYRFDNEYDPWIRAEFSHSEYSPQRNSGYSAAGSALRVGAGAAFFDKRVLLDIHYLNVDARYDPFVLQIPQVAQIATPLWRAPYFDYYPNLYSLHDTEVYPQNRQGIRANLTWKFAPTGQVVFDYGNLSQKTTSLQDVRFSANALGNGLPNTPVLGYSPGFIDANFGPYHPATFAPSGNNLLAVPLENPRGQFESFGFAAGYKLLTEGAQGITFTAGFKNLNYYRGSNLSSLVPGPQGLLGENQNFVNFTNRGFRLAVDYDFTQDFTAGIGFSNVDIYGHNDPFGVYGPFAVASGNARYPTLDITQRAPEINLKWEVQKDVTWTFNGTYFFLNDNVDPRVFATPTNPGLNQSFGAQLGTHPFNWQGLQLNSSFRVAF